jgi:hypothetical protein
MDANESSLVNEGFAIAAVRGNYNNVTLVFELLGVIFLGVVAILLWVGWRRSETRYQKLVEYIVEERMAS